ncbi:MAG: sigma-70 family RNA polymerase sigma factor [Opitutus sp.]
MPAPDSMPFVELTSDAELVAATLAGDRRAFGKIVERYQRLLCSLAYSATGQLSQSEDLAQEAFVDAWRQLGRLREPEKLRSWLCGILRFKASHLRRSDGREPVRMADPIDDSADHLVSTDELASDQAVRKEEQAIMWSALERVPETYREPLILYYREHRSVEHVAAALDLTEDAVKQRLARGRKILQEQVLTFVEGALARSTPGRVFTLGVLAALPEIVLPAKVIGLGAAATKIGMIAKTSTIAGIVASLSGVVSTVVALRTNLEQSRTPRERREVVKITIAAFFSAIGTLVLLYFVRSAAYRWWEHRAAFAMVAQGLVVAFVVLWPMGIMRVMRRMRSLRSAERRAHPECFLHAVDQVNSAAGEYKSRVRIFGVPLVHVRFATADEGSPPVVGWFAGGDRAFGLIFASGGLAVAPISMGAIAVGVLAVGSVSVGAISLGTFAIGLLALGTASFGVKAMAWLVATGWKTAQSGGFAIARLAAEGPVAFAQHANDGAARAILADPNAERNHALFLATISLLAILPTIAYARAVSRRLGAAARAKSS